MIIKTVSTTLLLATGLYGAPTPRTILLLALRPFNNVDAKNNTAIGQSALLSTSTTGSENTALGAAALSGNLTGATTLASVFKVLEAV